MGGEHFHSGVGKASTVLNEPIGMCSNENPRHVLCLVHQDIRSRWGSNIERNVYGNRNIQNNIFQQSGSHQGLLLYNEIV